MKLICVLFGCKFGFDESHPNLEDVGFCCLSGVGNLIGDRLPFVCCGAAIVVVEGDPNSVEVDGVPMGAIEMLASVTKVSICKWEKRIQYCGMWGVFSV